MCRSSSSPLLLIFVRNPIAGQVKQRLATKIGAEKALDIYLRLLSHTQAVTAALPIPKWVYYSQYCPQTDCFDTGGFVRKKQQGDNLGSRMGAAFAAAFSAKYRPVLIIGSDCAELRTTHLEAALHALAEKPYVLGPAKDGGYYLLGMRTHTPALFTGVDWGSDQVAKQTLARLPAKNYICLPTLRDIDRPEDLSSLLFYK